jgi:hypothetical protein
MLRWARWRPPGKSHAAGMYVPVRIYIGMDFPAQAQHCRAGNPPSAFAATSAAPCAAPVEELAFFPCVSAISCRLIIPWSGVRLPPGLLDATRCCHITNGDISRHAADFPRHSDPGFRCQVMPGDVKRCEVYGTMVGTCFEQLGPRGRTFRCLSRREGDRPVRRLVFSLLQLPIFVPRR